MLNRLTGLDTEYGCMMEGSTPEKAATYLLKKSVVSDSFLPNGGRFYLDCGHPEAATPECLCPYEAVRYHLGFDLFLDRLRQANEREGRSLDVLRDNMDSGGTTYGCHENYLMPRSVHWRSQLARTLIPFLISRLIFTGNGHLDAQGHYYLSQRAMALDSVQAKLATRGSRSILNRRDECLIHGSLAQKYRRLHLTIGDANVSHWANLLKVGVTSIILSMIEAGYNLSFLYPKDPLRAIASINADPSLKQSIETRCGKRLTALEIQLYYCERADRFLRKTRQYKNIPEWMSVIWSRWAQTLDELASYKGDEPTSRLWAIDWIAKQKILELWRQENPKASVTELLSMAMQYHNTDPTRSLAWSLETELCVLERYFSRDELEDTAAVPSRFLRAQERAAAVIRPSVNGRILWEGVMVNGQLQPFSFPDIFDN